MSLTPREIGTLIVVVLRAVRTLPQTRHYMHPNSVRQNHLPNKRHIGKQDPYCLVVVNGEKRRTKAIKRGGQHPEWDEEIRFTLFEDVDDVLARTAQGDGATEAPPPPPKDDKKLKKIKGGKIMRLACYADDPREPDLIGETEVDLTEVLTKGETDGNPSLASFWASSHSTDRLVQPDVQGQVCWEGVLGVDFLVERALTVWYSCIALICLYRSHPQRRRHQNLQRTRNTSDLEHLFPPALPLRRLHRRTELTATRVKVQTFFPRRSGHQIPDSIFMLRPMKGIEMAKLMRSRKSLANLGFLLMNGDRTITRHVIKLIFAGLLLILFVADSVNISAIWNIF